MLDSLVILWLGSRSKSGRGGLLLKKAPYLKQIWRVERDGMNYDSKHYFGVQRHLSMA